MMELRRLREIEELSILNQSPKRVSLRGRKKPCYLRWCPGSRVGATESVPFHGHNCPIYTRACRSCLRQWAPWNLLRHCTGVMNEWGRRKKRNEEGPTARGFSRRASTRVKGWLETCAMDCERRRLSRRTFVMAEEREGGRMSLCLCVCACWKWGRLEQASKAMRPVMMTGLCGEA